MKMKNRNGKWKWKWECRKTVRLLATAHGLRVNKQWTLAHSVHFGRLLHTRQRGDSSTQNAESEAYPGMV